MSDQDTRDQPLTQPFAEELVRFAEDLRVLRISCGNPPLRTLEKNAPTARPLSASALSEAFNGRRLPRLDFLMAVVRILLAIEDDRPVRHDDGRLESWRVRWKHMERLRLAERNAHAAARKDRPGVTGVPTVDDGRPAQQDGEPGGEEGPDLLSAAQSEAEGIKAVASARAEQILADAQAERDQAAVELAQLRSRVAEELAAAREDARQQREQAAADAARMREQAERDIAARLAAASETAQPAADAPGTAEADGDGHLGNGAGDKYPRSRRQRGGDTLIRQEITLEEAAFGTTKDIQVDTTVTCATCNGEGAAPGTSAQTCDMCSGRGEVSQVVRSFLGQVMTSRPCPQCQGFGTVLPTPCPGCAGDGRVRARRTLTVKIPAGVDNGTRIRLDGEGGVGPGGGPPGDLYIEIAETAHPVFQRRGDDLHCTVTIPVTAAILGTQVPLETLDGLEEVDIRPGTQSGQSIPMHGRGITHLRGASRGDLIVHVEVHTPTKLDPEQEELVRRLAKLRGEERPSGTFAPGQQGLFSRLKDAFNGR